MSGKKEVKKVKTQAEKNAAEIKANGFLNPFSSGVTYKAYLDTLKKDETVADNLKDKVIPEQLKWLLNDLQNLKN